MSENDAFDTGFDQASFAKRLLMTIGREQLRPFARRAGMTDTGVRRYLIEGGVPSIDKAAGLAKAGGVDFAWLCLGVGTPPQFDPDGYVIRDTAGVYAVADTTHEFTLVDSYAIEASAGHGALVSHDVKTEPVSFRTDWLRKEGLEPSRLAVIRARGDSMEPTISDGDVILVQLAAPGELSRDGLHVLRMDGGLFVKRVQFNPFGGMEIVSDNKAYQAYAVAREQRADVQILGRVVWAGRKF